MNKKNVSQLIDQATKARLKAHAPYSRFKVGAAVLSKGGKIYTGCNVENASYGLTICAERNAVANMVHGGEKQISAVVVVTDLKSPASPCGACRQVIAEFGQKAAIITANLKGTRRVFSLAKLYPNQFSR